MPTQKQDWLQYGLKLLSELGASGLTIDRLTQGMGFTKGSFYYHFRSGRDFEEQLIAYWADQFLYTIRGLPDQLNDWQALLDQIIEKAYTPTTEPEVAIRAWAQQDAAVREVVEQVDSVRRSFLKNVFEHLTADASKAELMADFLFALLIGAMTSLPRYPSQQVQALYREFKRLYTL